MSISIAVSGDNYFLCGPQGNNVAGAKDPKFRDAFRHGSNIHHTYITIGEDGAYLVKYADSRTGKIHWSWSLGDYEPLGDALSSNSGVEPTFVALGPNGYYFMRTETGARYWRLPDSADRYVETNNDVDKVWLGKDGAWVAQRRSGAARWDLRGNYGSLDNAIKYASADIKTLGLNLLNDRSYFVLFKDGRCQCNPTGTDLTESVFKAWAARF